MAKHKVTDVKIVNRGGTYDNLRTATGKVNGKPFSASEYYDHHALQGAQPKRWGVGAASRKHALTFGERLAVARRLHRGKSG